MSARRRHAINDARLDTSAGLRVLRDAAKNPAVWNAHVHPEVKNVLLWAEAQMQALGGTLDEVLGEVEAYVVAAEQIQSASSRQQIMAPLAFVEAQLGMRLEAQRESAIGAIAIDDAQRASADKARHARRSKADATAERYQREIDALRAERPTLSKTRAIAIVAGRQKKETTPDTIRKSLERLAKRIK